MKNIVVLCTLVALACMCHLACAGWTVDDSAKENGKYTATDAAQKLKIEVVTVQSDPVYDTEKDEALKQMNTNHSTDAYNEKSQLYPTSLAMRVTHNGKVIYSLAEGKAPPHDFLKLGEGTIDNAVLSTLKTAMAELKIDDERVDARLKTIPAIIKLALDHQDKPSSGASLLATNDVSKVSKSAAVRNHPITAAAHRFRQKFPQSLLQTKEQVGAGNVRFFVHVYTATAFYVLAPAEHSCTNIVKMGRSGLAYGLTTMCNHGRCPNQCAYKCTHHGAFVDDAQATDPSTWMCTTPYWAWNCFRGPNHNCNAATTHQIECSDSPANPPAHNAGICAKDCPMRSPAC